MANPETNFLSALLKEKIRERVLEQQEQLKTRKTLKRMQTIQNNTRKPTFELKRSQSQLQQEKDKTESSVNMNTTKPSLTSTQV